VFRPADAALYRPRLRAALDRIDIQVDVLPVHYADLATPTAAASACIRARVNAVRARQYGRFAGTTILHNTAMGVRELRRYCQLALSEGTGIYRGTQLLYHSYTNQSIINK
jgi:predicted ATPase with chaperone activity